MPVPLFKVSYSSSNYMISPKQTSFSKQGNYFSQAESYWILDSVTVCTMFLGYIIDIYETWGPRSLNHVALFHLLCRPVLTCTLKCKSHGENLRKKKLTSVTIKVSTFKCLKKKKKTKTTHTMEIK